MYRRRRSIFDIMREMEEEFEEEVESMLARLKELELSSRCLEPFYELLEGPEEYVLRVDLPGADRDRLEIRARGRLVNIYAPCNYSVPYREGVRTCATCYRLEVELPQDASWESVRQRFKEGVLELRIPRKVREYRIKIE
ncbi:MAG: Hsp20/alpha crystallin family protein [Nitrososphaerota archaeon]